MVVIIITIKSLCVFLWIFLKYSKINLSIFFNKPEVVNAQIIAKLKKSNKIMSIFYIPKWIIINIPISFSDSIFFTIYFYRIVLVNLIINFILCQRTFESSFSFSAEWGSLSI